MLLEIQIKNFILVESEKIEFSSGLNLITGETGAGKSILFKALSFLFGAKASPDWIKNNQSKAVVEACFEIDHNSQLVEFLNSLEIDSLDGEPLIIRRILFENGKTRFYLNDHAYSLNVAANLRNFLVEILGQNAHRDLMTSEKQKQVVDLFAGTTSDLTELKKRMGRIKELDAKIETLKACNHEQIPLFRQWLDELQEIDLSPETLSSIKKAHDRITHLQQIRENYQVVSQAISNDLLDRIYIAQKHLAKIADFSTTYQSLHESAKDLYHQLNELQIEINAQTPGDDFTDEEITAIEAQISLLEALKKKHHCKEDELIQKKQFFEKQIQQAEQLDSDLGNLGEQRKSLFREVTELAKEISLKRKKSAKELEKKITDSLQQYNMKDAQFVIAFTEAPLNQTGFDQIEFQVKTNLSTPLTAMKQCASGGEMSRIMLALETALSEHNNTPLLLLDEIDSGIGGETAAIIAKELKKLSTHKQVIGITHFPQVAIQADHHLQITKNQQNGQTISSIQILCGKKRLEEIQRMIGGEAIANSFSEIALDQSL